MGRAFEYRKAKKLKRWGSMSKTFTKIGKDITIAVKSGGPDPDTNSRLRMLIQNAKSANMPKDNVERAIKKAASPDTSDYREVVYEGYGPHGIAVLVETTTDNPTRTVANVRSYFTRNGGSLGTSGSLSFMFEHKCVFKVKSLETIDPEELELELIDFGVSELFSEENEIVAYADFESYGALQKYFEDAGFEILSAEFDRIPTQTKTLTPDQATDMEKMLAKFEDDDDVSNVFHNMKEQG
jgi:YebC/PmpR family DNA-binding regulatory protein